MDSEFLNSDGLEFLNSDGLGEAIWNTVLGRMLIQTIC